MIQVFRPSIGEEEIKAVADVLRSGWLGSGPKTAEFEQKFAKKITASYALATNSATAALNVMCYTFLNPGDEVITPSFTFIASNNAIRLANAVPIFADIDPVTLTIDPDEVEKNITKKTKAILAVHYGGQPANMKKLQLIAKKHKLLLFEDCAHATGTYYYGKHAGNFSDAAAFSFAAIKNMTTGDGGMVVSPHKRKIERMRMLCWSGISKSTWQRSGKKIYSWEYNVKELGWKYQMNDIAAAIGLVQLEHMDAMNEHRRGVAHHYQKAFQDLSWARIPVEQEHTVHAFHNYFLLVEPSLRQRLIEHLAKKNVSSTVHYYPNHMYPIYKQFRKKLPVTERIYKSIVNIPIFSNMLDSERDIVIDAVLSFKP